MFLCVWTAVHLNLPEHKKEREQTLRKVGWLLLALVAPEVVAWNAFEQRRLVKRLTRKMRKVYRQQHGIEDPKKRPWYHCIASWWMTLRHAQWLRRSWHKTKVFFLCEAGDLPPPPTGEWPAGKDEDAVEAFWTDVHSWYAVMGGFAFDTSSAARPFLPDSRERIVLTMDGLIALAEHWPHLVPRLSQGDIEDKSKSDGLAKLITCWQATWFCVQCICRLAQGLSISLLELNVFGHAICALLIYVLWWSKPKDISEPAKIVGEESYPVAAFMCNISSIGSSWEFNPHCGWRRYYPFIPYVVHDQDTVSQCRWYSSDTETVAYYPLRDVSAPGSLCIAGTYWRIDPGPISTVDYVEVDAITANRLLVVGQLLQISDPERLKSFSDRVIDLVCYRNMDWCIDLDFFVRLNEDFRDLNFQDQCLPLLQYLSGITLACGVYGGLHAAAWHASFPSSVEQLLWRTSSATVTSSGIGCAVFAGLYMLLDACGQVDVHSGHRSLEDASISVRLVLLVVFPLWYCFSRSFLVVESFICIAHISARDLGVPTWPSYVPHVS